MARLTKVVFTVLFRLLGALCPSPRALRRVLQLLRSAPGSVQLIALCLLIVLGSLSTNWLYQVARKPTELLFPLSGSYAKSPQQLWRSYRTSFERHSTPIMTPVFLAALAQIESSGNPLARTYWRWELSGSPLHWYAPASSAVGMYRITNATFEHMKRYCIHDHAAVEDGPWHEPRSCGFNWLYLRALPDHAIEMTSAYLDHQVRQLLSRAGHPRASGVKKRNLASVIHLCGKSAGAAYAARGFRARARQQCGSHSLLAYLSRLNALQTQFLRTDAAGAN